MSICSLHAVGQEIPTTIHGEKMKTFIALEKRLGSKPYQPEGDVIIPAGMESPMTYRRTEKDIPDLLVTYTFSKQDSLMYHTEYEWDMTRFEPNQKTQPLKIQKAFIKKYLTLVQQLDKKLGKSNQRGDLSDLTKIDLKGGLSRSDSWIPNDTTEVHIYSIFCNYPEEKGDVKIDPTNRIRLSISKMKKQPPELSEKAIMAAQKNYDQFIIKLRAGDLEGAKAYVSTLIKNQLTETAFNLLKASIKPGGFKIYYQTLQEINGTNYLVIQFAYDDAPEQPKEVIKVLFDKEHTIIGIQPLVWKEKT